MCLTTLKNRQIVEINGSAVKRPFLILTNLSSQIRHLIHRTKISNSEQLHRSLSVYFLAFYGICTKKPTINLIQNTAVS